MNSTRLHHLFIPSRFGRGWYLKRSSPVDHNEVKQILLRSRQAWRDAQRLLSWMTEAMRGPCRSYPQGEASE